MPPYDAELWSWEVYTGPYGHTRVRGIVAADGKGRWPDGRYIFTSPIVFLDREAGLLVTLNTRYKLCGEWKGPWEKRDPNTYELITQEGEVFHDNEGES